MWRTWPVSSTIVKSTLAKIAWNNAQISRHFCRRLLADYAYPHGSNHRLKARANSEFALGVLDVEVHGFV
jgi:hypothetical protein